MEWEGWTVLNRFRIGRVGGLCESDDEFSGSMKCGEYLDKLLTRCPDCGGVEGRHVQHLLLTCGNVI